MKTLILIGSMVLASSMACVGQNFMGMTHDKIIATLGEPDEFGTDYICYKDFIEDGSNLYFFDQNNVCISFEIIRKKDYLNEYKKMLKRDFVQTSENQYQKLTKKINYIADLKLFSDTFKILIHHPKCTASCCEKLTMAAN